MTTPTKMVWTQADRETPMAQERRTMMQAEATLEALWAIFDAQLDTLYHRESPRMFGRVLTQLSRAIQAAQTLTEAYDYYLARCADAGLSAADAGAAWDIHSSEAFEAELIAAESYGPNAMRLIDERILTRLGIAPYDVPAREAVTVDPACAQCGAPGEGPVCWSCSEHGRG